MIIALAVVAGVLGAFQFGKASISLNLIQDDFGVGLSSASLLVSVFGLCGATLGFALGSFARHSGVERAAVAGLVLGACGGLLGSIAPSFMSLLASRGVEAVGFLCVQVSAPTLVAAHARLEDRWLAFGIWGAYMPFGQALIIAVAPAILGSGGWRGLWLANAVLMASLALLAYLVLMRGRNRIPTVARAPRGRRVLPRPPGDTLSLGATFMTYTFQWITIASFLPSLYLGSGISLASAGPLTAAVLGVNVFGNLAGGVCARIGVPRWKVIFVASLVMGAGGLAIFSASFPFWASFICAVVCSGVGGAIPATVQIAVPHSIDSPDQMAAANGTVVQIAQIASTMGPVLIGVVVSLTGGWEAVGPILATVAVTGSLLSLRLRRIERRREAQAV